ncbi:p-hydroxybenzoic acid efflux pump subunit B [Escherichia coli]|uniref:p-hydroxybenzoic acid efflux pump subunit B n=1 Tax=Escherichia coli TaxID=562 RepID=A0A376LD47_ECOLX|nr:p-hydroxybenzoic acid efflux pump subunit B [Escherichia coli]
MGTLAALPLGLLYFLVIIPNTQQSMLLLCISLAVLGFFLGIEVQKRRLGSMGALASTINIIVLDNPMTFPFQSVSRQRHWANRRLCARVHRYFAGAG